ncbi:MAG: ATP-dependent DNA helicase RecG, partial [Bacilli bacterium]|nr:ATP-dependent DNA helicase RecG [Bacilli bacterium]
RINIALHKMGIFNYYQVINHLPRRYEILNESHEQEFVDKARVVIVGKITSPVTIKKGYKIDAAIFSITSSKLRRNFNVVAYNRMFLTKALKQEDKITLWGTYNAKTNEINMINYSKGELDLLSRIKPIYSLPTTLESREFVRIVKKALEETKDKIYSSVPFYFQNKYRLISKADAYKYSHFPISMEQVHQALRHLKYEEALMFSLKNKLIHEENKSLLKIKKEPIDVDICEPFISSLPFKLTSDQLDACSEIIEDMNGNGLMYRLLQGDVGTGKTVISFVALYANYYRGDQGAIMAPTDALARQHYKNALDLFKGLDIKIALLVGSTSTKEKEEIYRDLEEGYIDIIIGTHALFTKKTKYSSLGLVIIDEQHRFGVNQRQALLDKGKDADLLMMSATPIPRSLALSIYGDLDITTLSTYPNIERQVNTRIVAPEDKIIDNCIEKALKLHQKVYIVAPIIELDDTRFSVDELYKMYESKYPGLVKLLHGKLNAEEKEKALEEFSIGDKPILVSTQVIEVGIDVKSATLMVIYDASNFGLASLHQLRGRIGRDGSKAACLLVVDKKDTEGREKLSILVNSFDGFKIAEEDLKQRGPGDLTGLRQSGLPEFTFLNVIDDIKIFETARDDASYIIKHEGEKQFHYVIDRAKKLIEYKNIIKA